jgi:membrane protease YdiL (CAAX protease family)
VEKQIPVEDPAWSIPDVALLAVIAAIATAVFLYIFGIRQLAIYSETHPGEAITRETIERLTFNPFVLFWGQGLGYVVLLAAMIWMVRTRYQRPFWKSLRWNWPKAQWPVYVVGGIGLAIVVQFAQQFLPMPKSLPMQRYFETTEGAYLMAAFGILIAPPAEEFFFRGFLYPAVARWLARAVSSVGLLS